MPPQIQPMTSKLESLPTGMSFHLPPPSNSDSANLSSLLFISRTSPQNPPPNPQSLNPPLPGTRLALNENPLQYRNFPPTNGHSCHNQSAPYQRSGHPHACPGRRSSHPNSSICRNYKLRSQIPILTDQEPSIPKAANPGTECARMPNPTAFG